ncbi:MAG: hypothetical protein QM778_10350 [Myxococcales bacterium]
MKTSLAYASSIGLLVLAAAACGDDDRDPPPYKSGVKSDAPVSELSTEDKHKICETYGAHVDAYLDLNQVARAVCLPTSLLLGGTTEQSCEAYLADCTENFIVTGNVSARVQNEAACVASLNTCESSVVELEGCVNVNLNFVYDILDRLSCRRAGDEGAMREARQESASRQRVLAEGQHLRPGRRVAHPLTVVGWARFVARAPAIQQVPARRRGTVRGLGASSLRPCRFARLSTAS